MTHWEFCRTEVQRRSSILTCKLWLFIQVLYRVYSLPKFWAHHSLCHWGALWLRTLPSFWLCESNLNSWGPQASSDNLLSHHAICIRDKQNVHCYPQALTTNSLQLSHTLLYVYREWLVEQGCQGTLVCSIWPRFRCSLSCTLQTDKQKSIVQRDYKIVLEQNLLFKSPLFFCIKLKNVCIMLPCVMILDSMLPLRNKMRLRGHVTRVTQQHWRLFWCVKKNAGQRLITMAKPGHNNHSPSLLYVRYAIISSVLEAKHAPKTSLSPRFADIFGCLLFELSANCCLHVFLNFPTCRLGI